MRGAPSSSTGRARLALVCAAVVGWSPASWADGTLADRLFAEGRALQSLGRYDEACVKFDASEALEPAVGTLLNLADCAERAGATATAWQRYRAAAVLAATHADAERESLAKRAAAALEQRLSMLVLRAPAGTLPPDAVVQRDGATVALGDLPIAAPVDPGVHRVHVAGPGYTPWGTEVTVGPGPVVVSVDLPPLEREPVAPEIAPPLVLLQPPQAALAASAPAATVTASPRGAPWGWIVGGAGVAVLGAGTYLAFESRSVWSEVTSECPSGRCPDQKTANDLAPREEVAQRNATIATVGVVGGAAMAATGLVMLLLGRRNVSRVGMLGAPVPRGGLLVASLPLLLD